MTQELSDEFPRPRRVPRELPVPDFELDIANFTLGQVIRGENEVLPYDYQEQLRRLEKLTLTHEAARVLLVTILVPLLILLLLSAL